MSKDLILSVKDLNVRYETSEATVYAVNGVTFELEKGKTLGLVGETGAGKTTIARSILRILQTPPAKITDGEIWLEDQNLLQISEKEMQKIRGRRITMIFQDPMTALNPVKKIGNQIAEVVALHNGGNKKDAKNRAIEMLEMVGIPAERYDEYPHQFSGGMKQRVVIAIALACNPDLLLADEPTSALDVTIQSQVLELMRKLNESQRASMILITHDLGVVAEMCDTVAVVYAGQIVEIGTKEDLFDHPTHPYTEGLFGAIPHLDVDTDRLSPIAGMPPDPTIVPKGCSFYPRCPYATDKCMEHAIEMYDLSDTHKCRCVVQTERKARNGSNG